MKNVAKVLSCVFLFSATSSAASIQFVIAELPGKRFHGDSYVISIDEQDTDRLAHARALVEWVSSGANPEDSPGLPIVLVDVAAGSNGVNRNVYSNGERFWSWHPTGPIEFADNTIEILDGWPSFVEQDVDAWIDNTDGVIGFWDYTVVEELSVVPEPSSFPLLAGACGAMFFGLRRRTWRQRKQAIGSRSPSATRR